MAALRGQHPTWNSALVAHLKDARFARSVAQTSGSFSSPERKALFRSQARDDLATASWVEAAMLVDPCLVQRVYAGRSHGHSVSYCWHCGAGGPTKELAVCVRCEMACFCSVRCQREAWWWHKATEMGEHHCKPAPAPAQQGGAAAQH